LKLGAQGYIGLSMEVVPWNNLRIGKKYFVVPTSYTDEKRPVVIRSLTFMNQGEAMIYDANSGNGYAVGGKFDKPGGPKNVFWTDPDEDYSEPAASPNPDPASPKPPPPLDLSTVKMSQDEWAMAYGLRRCRLCGYNEGPEICPNNCYAVKKEE
jgi:hypothetical protein